MGKRKAFEIRIVSWPGLVHIVPAETAAAAKGFSYCAANEAGYDVPFVDFRVRRAPRFDDLARATEGKYPWCLGWRVDGEAWGCLAE